MIENVNHADIPLLHHPAVSKKARKALLEAIDEDWTVSELQPLLYVHIIEEDRLNPQASAPLGCTERINNLLSNSDINYILDLVELTTAQLLEKTRDGIGVMLYGDLIWALGNFDRHAECVEPFLKAMMPNPYPEGYRGGGKTEWGHELGTL